MSGSQVDVEVDPVSSPTEAASGAPRSSPSEPDSSRPRARAALVVGEAGVAVLAAVISLALSRSIDVNPLDRVGQVSGLAALDLRYVILGLAVLAVVGAIFRWAPARFAEPAQAFACAAVAGLVSGLIAGGLVVALRGTTWPLFANSGDAGQLAMWAQDVLAGGSTPSTYPPLPVYVMAWWSDLTGTPPSASLRALQVGGAAIFGPAAYLAWRLLVRPTWALVLVLVAALPLMDLYKPYTNVVLVVLLPVLAHLLTTLKRSDRMSWSRLGLAGAAYGVVLGVLFLAYSGWFVWSALGLLAAAVVVFPWIRAPLRGAVLALTTSVAFVLVAARHLFGMLLGAGAVKDRFFYFDTGVEPAYIAMWRNDTPGDGLGPWPPPGEFAGMGVFSAMLVVGLGLALALGRRRVDVLVLASAMAGAWLVRLYIASRMYADHAVQLYPRTTAEILYSLLALSAIGAMLLVRRGAAALRERTPTQSVLPAQASERRHLPRVVALLSAALLAGLFMGSATADRYMPRNDGSAGYLAFVAHHVRQEDGRCATYVLPSECLPSALAVEQLRGER